MLHMCACISPKISASAVTDTSRHGFHYVPKCLRKRNTMNAIIISLFSRRRGFTTVAHAPPGHNPLRLTRGRIDVSDVHSGYSGRTTVSIRVRFAREFGGLLLPLHTYRQDGDAYVHLADVLNIRLLGCRAVERSPPHGPAVIVLEIIIANQWFCSFVTAAMYCGCPFRSGNLGLAPVFIYLCVSFYHKFLFPISIPASVHQTHHS